MNTITLPPMTVMPKAVAPQISCGCKDGGSPGGACGRDSVERIRHRAYEIYQDRSRKGEAGDEESDWVQAEYELNGSAGDPAASRDVDAARRERGEELMAEDE